MTVKEMLDEAIEDEYKARATYRNVLKHFGEVRPFSNIAEAEGRHVSALLLLFARYGIEVPKDSWDSRVETPRSITDACRVGVEAEIENVKMYDRLLKFAEAYPDIKETFLELQSASRERHLPAFERCAGKSGRT